MLVSIEVPGADFNSKSPAYDSINSRIHPRDQVVPARLLLEQVQSVRRIPVHLICRHMTSLPIKPLEPVTRILFTVDSFR